MKDTVINHQNTFISFGMRGDLQFFPIDSFAFLRLKNIFCQRDSFIYNHCVCMYLYIYIESEH